MCHHGIKDHDSCNNDRQPHRRLIAIVPHTVPSSVTCQHHVTLIEVCFDAVVSGGTPFLAIM
jgi:hypothetical protein